MKIKTFMPFAIAAVIIGIVAVFGYSRVAHAATNLNLVAVEATDLQQRADMQVRQTDATTPGEIIDPTGFKIIDPTITTNLATGITSTNATLNGYFDQGNMLSDTAVVSFQYGTSPTNLSYGTTPRYLTFFQNIPAAYIGGLKPGTTYYYRAVMQYLGKTTYGATVSFTTHGGTTTSSTGSTSNTGSTNGNGSSSNTGSNTGSTSNNNGSSNTGSSSSSNTNSSAASSFARLSITDGETKIERGDEVTYKVTYEARQSLRDAELVVELPAGMTITDSSRGKIDKGDATVTVDIGDMKAGQKRTIEIDARLNKNYRDGKDMTATAELSFETTSGSERSLVATDETEFSGDSGLGASIFGAGVAISFFQWILIAGILAAIIILARKQFAK